MTPPNNPVGALYKKGASQRGLFAGFCRHTANCARAGDSVAEKIIYSAGRDMGLQMIAAIKRAESQKMIDAKKDPPIVYASGGAWKGTPHMLLAMEETILSEYPGAICKHGLFDPVIAGVIQFIFEKTQKREISKQTQNHLEKEFEDYLFKFDGEENL
jgi:N-acetylglucosamine kinase-like BadF-type ATPase